MVGQCVRRVPRLVEEAFLMVSCSVLLLLLSRYISNLGFISQNIVESPLTGFFFRRFLVFRCRIYSIISSSSFLSTINKVFNPKSSLKKSNLASLVKTNKLEREKLKALSN